MCILVKRRNKRRHLSSGKFFCARWWWWRQLHWFKQKRSSVVASRRGQSRHGGARWQRVSHSVASHKLSSELNSAGLLRVSHRSATTVSSETSGSRCVSTDLYLRILCELSLRARLEGEVEFRQTCAHTDLPLRTVETLGFTTRLRVLYIFARTRRLFFTPRWTGGISQDLFW